MALDKITRVRGQGLSDPLLFGGDLNGNNANFVGVVTATTFQLVVL